MGNGGGFRRVRRSSRRRKRPRRGHIHRQIEEVCSGDLFGPGRRGRDVGDGQRRGVRRQDDVVRGVFVDGREQIPSGGQLFGCRLDNKVRAGDGPLEVRPGVDPREHLLPRFVELALLRQFPRSSTRFTRGRRSGHLGRRRTAGHRGRRGRRPRYAVAHVSGTKYRYVFDKARTAYSNTQEANELTGRQGRGPPASPFDRGGTARRETEVRGFADRYQSEGARALFPLFERPGSRLSSPCCQTFPGDWIKRTVPSISASPRFHPAGIRR